MKAKLRLRTSVLEELINEQETDDLPDVLLNLKMATEKPFVDPIDCPCDGRTSICVDCVTDWEELWEITVVT